ncbi:MAG TPA: GerMN domain-containing protein [Acidimicrobiales bacterium]|nr:GerMN domain-containing protein [Acidimicrobiales bacterium]
MRMIIALCLVVALASCGVGEQSGARVFDASEVPYGLIDTTPPPTTSIAAPFDTATPTTVPYDLYFIRSDVLVAVTRRAATLPAPADLVTTLVAGPTRAEVAAGHRSAITGPEIVTRTSETASMVTVDLARAFNEIPRSDRIFALGQITLTLTAGTGVALVQYTIADAPIEVPKANGVVTRDPVTRGDYTSLLEGATSSPSTVTSTTVAPSSTSPTTPPTTG